MTRHVELLLGVSECSNSCMSRWLLGNVRALMRKYMPIATIYQVLLNVFYFVSIHHCLVLRPKTWNAGRLARAWTFVTIFSP